MKRTLWKLQRGAQTERQRIAIEALLGAMTVLPFGLQEAKITAKLRVELVPEGSKIGMADYLIGSVCLCRHAVLLTRNLKHFQRVPGLRISGQY